MKKIKILITLLVIATIITFVAQACQKTEQVSPTTPNYTMETEQKLDFIASEFGFHPDSLRVTDEDIIAEHDIIFPLENFWENYGQVYDSTDNANGGVQERKHYSCGNFVSTPNPPRWITVNVRSTVPSGYVDAIYDACVIWNGLNLNVRFAPQCGSQDILGAINVKGATLANNEYASCGFPFNGNPGYTMKINTSPSGPTTTAGQKVYVIVHELGHGIGFRHSDGNYGTWITNVSNACKNNPDPNSVMKAAGVPNWSAFTSCDVQAFDTTYGFVNPTT